MSTLSDDVRERFTTWRSQVRRNFYDSDPHLPSLLRHYGRSEASEALSAFGQTAADLDPLIVENNRDEHLPRLRRYDGQGNRIEQVDFHPSYHEIGRRTYASGIMSHYAEPGKEFETLSLLYLSAHNGEGGHNCPLACTAGLIKMLQKNGDGAPSEWLERLLDPDYDTHFHGAQFLTEVQGGSDVGANSVVARPADDGAYTLHGEKWFCSVIDAQLFLVTARPEDAPPGTRGVMAFAVPRTLPDGSTNHFNIRRLKYKLGTRSMASGEVDFVGAWAWPIGDFKDCVGIVLNTSRLYNAVVNCGMLERVLKEAEGYAQTRLAFGQPILKFPAVARTIAGLRAETYGTRAVSFYLADLADRLPLGQASTTEEKAWRMLVNLNKYWASATCTGAIRDAIEVLGGNGAIEEFSVLPRMLRDSIVCEQWEGPHNVLCAQVLRDCQRLGLHEALFDTLDASSPNDAGLQRARVRWNQLLALPAGLAITHVRDVVDELRAPIQVALLRAEAATEGSAPLLAVVADHLETIHAPGYDALSDASLLARVRALT